MTVKDPGLKERLIRRIGQLNDSKLEALEAQLDELTKPTPEEIERRLAAWRGVAGMLSDPEEYAEWEASARRRPLFGGRTFDLELDE